MHFCKSEATSLLELRARPPLCVGQYLQAEVAHGDLAWLADAL